MVKFLYKRSFCNVCSFFFIFDKEIVHLNLLKPTKRKCETKSSKLKIKAL